MVSNHNSRTKDFEKVLEKKKLKNKLSTLELTKESFFICKNVQRCCFMVFERENKVLEKMETKKLLSLTRVLIEDIR